MKAVAVRVAGGGSQANVVFSNPAPKGYTVRGFVSTNDRTAIGDKNVEVTLVSRDGAEWFSGSVAFTGFWPAPGLKYFAIENVPPGRYVAYVTLENVTFDRIQDWTTKVVDVEVTGHSKLIWLELTHVRRAS